MFDCHRYAAGGGCLAERWWERVLQGERVVAGGFEGAGDIGEEVGAVVLDLHYAAVHRLWRLRHLSPLPPTDALMAEADAEERLFAAADRLGGDAEVSRRVRAPRSRGDDDVVELQALQLIPRRLVIPHHERLHAVHLRQELEEVEGERVVVVDQQRAHRRGACRLLDPCGHLKRHAAASMGKIPRRWQTAGSPTARAASSRRCSWSSVSRLSSRLTSIALRTASRRSTRR